MQMLCPNPRPAAAFERLAQWFVWVFLSLFWMPWAAASTDLGQHIHQWAVERYGLTAEQIRVFPTDPRVTPQSCATPWQLDQPFANNTTVRARCSNPNHQLFVRLEVSGHSASAPGQRVDKVNGNKPEESSRPVVTTTTVLARGTRLLPEHVVLQPSTSNHSHSMALEQIEDAVGAELVRHVPAGTVLRLQDLRPALMVRKGQWVQLQWEPVQGFLVGVKLEALQDGRMGDTIRLINPESGKVLNAKVTGPNTAQGL